MGQSLWNQHVGLNICVYSVPFLKYMSDRNVCIFLPKVLHINVHSSTILISPKKEITRIHPPKAE